MRPVNTGVIKNFVRGFSALSLALVPLLSAPAAQAAPAAEVVTLTDAVGPVQVTTSPLRINSETTSHGVGVIALTPYGVAHGVPTGSYRV
ncbi:hypothetical protein GCM10010342_27330 [Streptomyces anulatus]|nr:hypothetical protein GCM10010342_27330 [Streptomyces anulatus]